MPLPEFTGTTSSSEESVGRFTRFLDASKRFVGSCWDRTKTVASHVGTYTGFNWASGKLSAGYTYVRENKIKTSIIAAGITAAIVGIYFPQTRPYTLLSVAGAAGLTGLFFGGKKAYNGVKNWLTERKTTKDTPVSATVPAA